jgi:uncharacterized protein YkwD
MPTPSPIAVQSESQSTPFPQATTAPSEVAVATLVTTPTTPPSLTVAAEEPVSPPLRPSVIQHTVQPGETLLGLAAKYGISMAAIQLANGLGNSFDLIAGQTLSIPGSTQWLEEGFFWIVHVVQPGETLVGLSSTYDLTVDDILHVNAIADPALIHVDQQLVMPLTQLVTLKAPQPTEPSAAIAAAPPASDGTAEESSDASGTTSGTASTAAEPAAAPPPPLPAGPADWPGYILARINQVRAEHGLNTLALVSELSSAAQAHAEDCARRGWGSHVGSDGAVLQTRLERIGYAGRNWGENWVQALNAERAFDWWYGEIPPNDPHRRNILSRYYTEIGIGIAQTDWGYIFVTDFGRR